MKATANGLFAAVVFSSAALAQSPHEHDHDHDIEHVLVTMPLHRSSMETAFPTDSLSGDTLAREAAATLGDTLESLPGIHNASFGPGVGQPVIRGLSGPRVMTLQNGTRSADVSSISGDHTVAVEPLLADSIEVLRGPASLLYGGSAIGGVINVVDGRIPTTVISDTEIGAAWRYTGANSGQSGVFRVDTGIGDLSLHVDWMARTAEATEVPNGIGSDDGDILENTDSRATSGTIGGAYHFAGGFLGMSVNWQDNNYGLPEGTHAHHGGHGEEGHELDHDDDHHAEGEDHGAELVDDHGEESIRLDMQQTRYDLALHLHNPLPGIETLRGFVTSTEYEHAELEGTEIGTVYASDTLEGRLEVLHTEVAGVHGVAGVQISDSSFSAVGDESFVPETDISRGGVFLLEDWHSGPWQLEAGLRFDRDELTPQQVGTPARSYTAFSASLGTIFEVNPSWSASASVSRAERAPAVEELYSNFGNINPDSWVIHAATGAVELGNVDLDTETGINLDLGLRWRSGAHNASLAIYLNDFDRFINLTNTGLVVDETPVRRYSQEQARFVGLEFEGEWRLASMGGGDIYLDTAIDIVRGELDKGGDIPRLPPLTTRLGVNWSDESTRYFARVTAAGNQNRPGDNEEPTDSWQRWDLGGEWQLAALGGSVTLSAALRNITNQEIRLSTSWLRDVAPEPGRSFDVGFRLEL